jgi:hypothetical protein
MPIKLFKRKQKKPVLSSANSSLRERLGQDAYTGWVVILAVSFLTLLSFGFFAGQLFFLINSGGITAPDADVPAGHAAFDPMTLDQVVADFDARSAAFSALRDGYVGPPDPSQ